MKPILFSPQMVRAILAGKKTETRRIYKKGVACPYTEPGARGLALLWVREGHQILPPPPMGGHSEIVYRADLRRYEIDYTIGNPALKKQLTERYPKKSMQWRASIHMPKWATRIHLLVEECHSGKLLEITDMDARAEGFKSRDEFLRYWDSLNIRRGVACTAKHDPDVWVVKFKPIIWPEAPK